VHPHRGRLHPDCWRHGLDCGKLGGPSKGGISENGHSLYARCNLFEKLQPFRGDAVIVRQESGGVAARVCQALNEAGTDRIRDNREYDRNRTRRLQQRCEAIGADRHDDVWGECNQFGCVGPCDVGVIRGPAKLDSNVATVSPAQSFQDLKLRTRAMAAFGSAGEQDSPRYTLHSSFRTARVKGGHDTDPPFPCRARLLYPRQLTGLTRCENLSGWCY
jgi:hypothetical protein